MEGVPSGVHCLPGSLRRCTSVLSEDIGLLRIRGLGPVHLRGYPIGNPAESVVSDIKSTYSVGAGKTPDSGAPAECDLTCGKIPGMRQGNNDIQGKQSCVTFIFAGAGEMRKTGSPAGRPVMTMIFLITDTTQLTVRIVSCRVRRYSADSCPVR